MVVSAADAAADSPFRNLQQRFNHVSEFAIVYLAEAHASDEWPLGRHVQISQHRSLQDRAAAATAFASVAQLKATLPVPMLLLDGVEDKFTSAYAAHPFRWFVFGADCSSSSGPKVKLLFRATSRRGPVKSASQGGYRGYELADLEEFLCQSLEY